MKKTLVCFISVLIAITLVIGSVSATEYTDDLGRTVEIPDTVSHIIPSGSLAQTVLVSFNPSYLVSLCTTYDDYAAHFLPDIFKNLPNTGSQFGFKRTMSDEEIMKLANTINVDFILDIGEKKDGMEESMDNLQRVTGVPFIFISQNTISEIPTSYQKIGNLIGEQKRGEELATYSQSVIDRFNSGMEKVGDKKVSMIYVTRIDGNSANIMGTGSKSVYHTSVIDAVATNVAPVAISGSGDGSEVNMEEIMKLDPDYIIVNASGNGNHDYYNSIMNSSQWLTLRAVKNGNVYEAPVDVPYNWMGQPPSSVNKLISMIWLANLYYPNVFNYDLKTEIQTFYKKMFNYDLSDEEYKEITKYSIKDTTSSQTTSDQTTKTPIPLFGILAGLGIASLFILKRR